MVAVCRHRCRAIVPALLIGLAACIWVHQAAAADSSDLDQQIELLDQATVRRVSLEFDHVPFQRAVREVGEAAGISVVVDRREIEETGFDLDAPVRMIFRSTPAITALEMLIEVLGEGLNLFRVEAYGGLLRVTSSYVSDRHSYVRRYEVRDLIADADAFERLALLRLDGDGEPEAEADPGTGAPVNRDQAMHRLIDALQEIVHPLQWRSAGGTRADLLSFAGGLYVTGPASTHRLVRNLLDEMRRSRSPSLIFESAIVQLERSAFAEAQARFPAGTRALARALMRGDGVRYRFFGSVSEGGTFRAEYGAGEERIGVAMSPRFDADRGLLTWMIGAQMIGPGFARSVDTDIDLAPDHQSIVLEIPGDPESDTGLFLIISLVQTR